MTAHSRGTRYSWYVVAVLLVLNVSSFIDRQVMALLVTPIKADLGLSDTQMGWLLGPAFATTFAFSVFIVGRLADRRSRPAIIAWGVAAWSVMCTASGVANTYGQLFASRVGVGIGEATLSPAGYSLIADYFPPEKLATAMSVFTSGVFIGSGLAYFIGGTVIDAVSNLEPWRLPFLGEIRDWQRVFILVGLPGLLLALLALSIREPRRDRAVDAPPVHAFTLPEVVAWLRRHGRAYLTFGAGIALYAVVNFGTAFWFPAFFERSHGWSPSKIGLLMGGATAIFGVVGVIAGGRLADRFKARGRRDGNLIVLIIAATISIIAALPLYLTNPNWTLIPLYLTNSAWTLIPLNLTNSEWTLISALIATNIAAAAPFGAAAAAMQEMSPRAMRGQAAALLVFLLNFVGLGLGPPAVALVTDYVFRDPTKVALSLLVVTLVGRSFAALSVAGGLAAHRRAVTEVTG